MSYRFKCKRETIKVLEENIEEKSLCPWVWISQTDQKKEQTFFKIGHLNFI